MEILARLVARCRSSFSNPLADVVYELPLDSWQDVAGSKLKKADLVKALSNPALFGGTIFVPVLPCRSRIPCPNDLNVFCAQLS